MCCRFVTPIRGVYLCHALSFLLYIGIMNQNKGDQEENEGLRNLVRSEWFTKYRWTAGLSTFIIGIAFTILTLMFDKAEWYNYRILFFYN